MLKNIVIFCTVLLFAQFSQPVFSADLATVPLEHEIYPFLDSMITKGYLPLELMSTKPITRKQVAEALDRIVRKKNRKKISLTKTEEEHLEKFIKLFTLEFSDKRKADYLLSLTGNNYEINFDPGIKQETFLTYSNSNDGTTLVSIYPLFFGEITDNFAFVTDFGAGILVDGEGYEKRPGEFQYSTGELEQLTTIEAYGSYGWRNLYIQLGKDDVWWGPGHNGSLILSDNTGSKDLLKFYAKPRYIKFTALVAELRERKRPIYIGDERLIWEGQKYLYAHRLETTLFDKINLGIYEAVVAPRLDIGYVNPFTVYLISLRMTEYGKGGGHGYYADNFLMGGDVTVNIFPGLQVYGEFLLDDYQPQKGLFSRNWDNKFGVMFGTHYTFRDLDLRAEYAFVNQYAYTHEFPSITSYTDRGEVIGHKVGPDSDDFWVNLTYWLNSKVLLSLAYEIERHGETSIDEPHEPDFSDEWVFLSGVIETTNSLDLRGQYNVIGDYLLELRYKYSYISNVSNKLGLEDDKHQIMFATKYRF